MDARDNRFYREPEPPIAERGKLVREALGAIARNPETPSIEMVAISHLLDHLTDATASKLWRMIR